MAKEVNNSAHLCPGTFKGRKIWAINCPINQFCRVKVRLFNQREVKEGKSRVGNAIATKISDTPNKVVLSNWLNRLMVMVRIKGWNDEQILRKKAGC